MLPQSPVLSPFYAEFLVRLLTDLAAIFLFAIATYLRRYDRRDLAVVLTFFNIGLFVVVTVITETQFVMAVGFGLFAMLAIIRLRSEPISNRELGYFFGALVLAILNAMGTQEYVFTLLLNGLVLGSMFILDHPSVLKSYPRRRIRLDAIYPEDETLRAELERRLGCSVIACTIVSIDYVRDTMDVEALCSPHSKFRMASQTGVASTFHD